MDAPPPVTHRRVLRLAGPIVLSNISVPLLGLADMAVIGRIPNPAALGAIALGGTIFNFVYWGFGFLRMGTTGLTAQALGARDLDEVSANLGRALLVAFAIGVCLIALQWPIGLAAFALLKGSAQVQAMAHDFFSIRIWSAPFTLANFALLGWFIGRQKADTALILQVFMNGLNIALNVTFVAGFGWAVKGVATGTVIAEIAAAGVGGVLAWRDLTRSGWTGRWARARLLDPARLARMISVNRDIMLRTFCLIFAFAFFTAQGARAGDVTLAANAVLGQFIALSAFLLDAFCSATEALVGEAVGARDKTVLARAVKLSSLWAGGAALALSAFIYFAGPLLIDVLSTSAEVREAARVYLPWAALVPAVAVWCFLLDGIFIGATRTVEMRNAMAVALTIFLVAWWFLTPAHGNHGLWAALVIFYAARAATLVPFYGAVRRAALIPDR
ncbi:MAG: MATE family efflux transporter [Parvibaculum sp.]|uniref:MATE family efflux transporter n=1 Tax=Parvibaculum sp. TaxID=2024848 RepID=UPI0025D3F947|nr:MATE family efflux transporter [Parvibaculum sp.]MCE9649896.1 MATE family efflux transporter [Parvibaculum sp.]